MNYLAHIYFSGAIAQRKLGGFIADAVKGKAFEKYPKGVREGIRRHREIDHWVDTRPEVQEELRKMRVSLGRYAPIVLDIFMDYFLANDFSRLTRKPFNIFCYKFYFILIINYRILPIRFKRFVWHFILSNRLHKYRHKNGIRESLEIMRDYRHIPIDVNAAMVYLDKNQNELNDLFIFLFSSLKQKYKL
ncbi:MAG: ACP phosphodiesterase [Bacteroidales bacterium]